MSQAGIQKVVGMGQGVLLFSMATPLMMMLQREGHHASPQTLQGSTMLPRARGSLWEQP